MIEQYLAAGATLVVVFIFVGLPAIFALVGLLAWPLYLIGVFNPAWGQGDELVETSRVVWFILGLLAAVLVAFLALGYVAVEFLGWSA